MLSAVVFAIAALAASANAYPGGPHRRPPPICKPYEGICDGCTENIDLPSCINVDVAQLVCADDNAVTPLPPCTRLLPAQLLDGRLPAGVAVLPENLAGNGAVPLGWTIQGNQITGPGFINPSLLDPTLPLDCLQNYGVTVPIGGTQPLCVGGAEPGFCTAVGTCLVSKLKPYDSALALRTPFCTNAALAGGFVDPSCWSVQTVGCSADTTTSPVPGNYFGNTCTATPPVANVCTTCPGGQTCVRADGTTVTTGAGICAARTACQNDGDCTAIFGAGYTCGLDNFCTA